MLYHYTDHIINLVQVIIIISILLLLIQKDIRNDFKQRLILSATALTRLGLVW